MVIRKETRSNLKSKLVSSGGHLLRTPKSPDEALGELFAKTQQAHIYDDAKTFADLVPQRRITQILREYELEKQDPSFDLRDFVTRHFHAFDPAPPTYVTNKGDTVSEHIHKLWDVLERRNRKDRGSLLALPYSYVVPGGRFTEQFYWDSYFIMLGLAADGRWNMIENMIKNCAYMLRKYGMIPTANRSYFVSRSQPPVFVLMVRLLARHRGRRVLAEYLPYLLLERRFWMKGRAKLSKQEHKAYLRVAEMPDGVILNRYYDNKMTPRPESLRQDYDTAEMSERDKERLFLHLRAGAESGWDFSSRWFMDEKDLGTIHTADIIPVDLNCLLYELDMTIAEAYRMLKQPITARRFAVAAEQRAHAIDKYCWNEQEGFYLDYNFHHREQQGALTLAAVFPLYSRIASSKQANAVAHRLEEDFLKPGGLQTSLVHNGQQWDAPNGWAPLQWMAIQGLRNYGHHALASEIKQRWVRTNLKLFQNTGKLVEKYDITELGGEGGGGEYPLQDGFGWTNGVLAALLAEK